MNVAGSDGLPAYFAKNIPVEDQGINVDARGAQIYFGEQQGGYVIVDAKQPSFNYPRQGVSDSLTPVPGQGRRAALERAAQGRVRTAVLATSTC